RILKMLHKRFELCAVFLLALGHAGLQAQESINGTGGSALGNGGSVSYSVGQVVYTANTNTSGSSVTQGVQQPYEISIVTGIETPDMNLLVLAYPNPATDYLILEMQDFEFSNLNFQLYDVIGKILQNQRITDNQTRIVMSNLMSGMYFLKVFQNNK